MKNVFIKYRIQIKLVLTLLFGLLAFIKWQEYRANNSKTDLIGFAIFGLVFIINVFDVRYYSRREIDSRNDIT